MCRISFVSCRIDFAICRIGFASCRAGNVMCKLALQCVELGSQVIYSECDLKSRPECKLNLILHKLFRRFFVLRLEAFGEIGVVRKTDQIHYFCY